MSTEYAMIIPVVRVLLPSGMARSRLRPIFPVAQHQYTPCRSAVSRIAPVPVEWLGCADHPILACAGTFSIDVIPSGISFDTLARAFRRHAGRRPGIHAFLGSSIVRRGWPACAGHDGWDRLCQPVRTSGAWYNRFDIPSRILLVGRVTGIQDTPVSIGYSGSSRS